MIGLIWRLPMWAHDLIFRLTGWVIVARVSNVRLDGTYTLDSLEWKRHPKGEWCSTCLVRLPADGVCPACGYDW